MSISGHTRTALVVLVLAAGAGCGAPAAASVAAPATATSVAAPAAATNVAAPATAQHVDLHFAGGTAQGGVVQVEVPLGAAVVVTMSSDVAQEMHVHGYDLHGDAPAGGVATVSFTATIPGIFEVEAEQAGTRLARIEVR